MRTRIALVAIIPVALITVSILTLTASAQSARAISPSPTTATSTTPVALPPSALAAYHGPRSLSPVLTGTSLLLHLNPALQAEAALHAAVLQHNADAAALPPPPPPRPPPPPPRRSRPDRSTPSRRSSGPRGNAWPCARRAATGPPMAVASAAVSASVGPTGSPTGVPNSPRRAPWPPRISRSWWPNESSPPRRTSTGVTAGSGRARCALSVRGTDDPRCPVAHQRLGIVAPRLGRVHGGCGHEGTSRVPRDIPGPGATGDTPWSSGRPTSPPTARCGRAVPPAPSR